MAVQKELWVNYIVDVLYKFGNEFLNFAKNDDQYVLAGKVVHKPNGTQRPGASKNREVLPAKVNKRSVVDAVYVLDEYTTDPELIENAEKIESSFDMMDSLMYNHMAAIRELVAEEILYKWTAADTTNGYAATSTVATTGASLATHLPGTTGNRLGLKEADLQKAKFTMNKQNVPKEKRFALVSSDMMDQLYNDLKVIYDSVYAKEVVDGVIPTLHGFKLIERPSIVSFTTGGVAKVPGAAAVATDKDSVFCWQEGCVARAMGLVDFFENTRQAEYYGDVYSALLRFGGQKERADAKGTLSIIQG